MKIETKGIHYELSDRLKEHIDKKLEKLKFAERFVDEVSLYVDKRHDMYVVEMNILFKDEGAQNAQHLKVENEDLYDAIDIMDEKATTKMRRYKEKKTDNSRS